MPRLGQRARQGMKDAAALHPVAVYESGRDRSPSDHQAIVHLIAELRALREAQEILTIEVRKLARHVGELYKTARKARTADD